MPSSEEESPRGPQQPGEALEEASLQAHGRLLESPPAFRVARVSQPLSLPARQTLTSEEFPSSWNMCLVITLK